MTDETAATNAAPDAIAPDSQVAESAPAGKEPAAPEKDGFSKRIDELTKNWRDTERDRDDAKRRADEAARDAQYWRDQALRAQQPREPAKPAETPPEAVKTLADFEYDEAKYQQYLFTQAEQRAVKAAERSLKEQQDRDAKERRKATFAQRETEFEKATPDYRSKTRSPSFPVSDAMAEVFSESDEGPAVAYYLANNLTLADQISKLPPLVAAMELGAIKAKLIATREQAAKKVSDAPPPPPKIEGAGDPKIEKDPKEMTDAEFSKWRRRQIAQRR